MTCTDKSFEHKIHHRMIEDTETIPYGLDRIENRTILLRQFSGKRMLSLTKFQRHNTIAYTNNVLVSCREYRKMQELRVERYQRHTLISLFLMSKLSEDSTGGNTKYTQLNGFNVVSVERCKN